jgi:uncharacterized protein with LGFP repeats
VSAQQRIMSATSRLLARRLDRRGVLTRAAVVGSALATSGLDYVLKPGTAYASVCGSGASCSSGWTAMCCTINNGVNQCPPGSFAGGWWKADGASLCGGHARYYIDCQAECTNCGCGSGAFCSSSCWNCRSHCADGPCDKRHVCHNVFRYGQCRRDKHCSGPVLCRTITCTPPWKWADCSTASATDNNTRSHSASCLSTWSHIARRWAELGSQGSVLGATVHAEKVVGHARVQHYQHGRMYWTHHTGAHYLTGDLLSVYEHLGATASGLGLPRSDDIGLDDHGRAAHFQHGGIYQKSGRDAHALWGNAYPAWIDSGGRTGPLGYLVTSRREVSGGGHYAAFEHGGIYDGPSTPLRLLTDPVDAAYVQLDRMTGPLGWPTTDVATLGDGVGLRARFQAGEIYSHPTYGTRALWGPLDTAYRRLGSQSGVLGYPDGDVSPVTGTGGVTGYLVATVNGAVALRTGTATAYGVWGQVFATWQANGGAGGSLGFPVVDMTVDSAGDQYCRFEHGSIYYDASTGRTTIS